MKNKTKIGFLLLLFSLVAGIVGISNKAKNSASWEKTPGDRATNEQNPTENRLTALEECPEIFSQNTDAYLTSQVAKNDGNQKCFVTGCGGTL